MFPIWLEFFARNSLRRFGSNFSLAALVEIDQDLFIYWNGGCADSVFHPFDISPPSIFGFQMLKINPCISTHGAGPSTLIGLRVYGKDGEIILCDTDVSQGSHVQKVGESLQSPVRCVCSWVFLRFFLRCSCEYFKHVGGNRLEIRIFVATVDQDFDKEMEHGPWTWKISGCHFAVENKGY